MKYAIVLTVCDWLPRTTIVNFLRPYAVPPGKEAEARRVLNRPGAMILIADKQTWLDNPVDLHECDFRDPLKLPTKTYEETDHD